MAALIAEKETMSLGDNALQGSLMDVVESAEDHADGELVAGKPWYVLDPRAPMMGRWDAITSVALIFTAFATPIEVGFLEAPETASHPLFIINRVVDGVFLLDIALSFVCMYKVVVVGRQAAVDANSAWEFRPHKTCLHYLKGWFAIDVGSVLPSAFDFVPIFSPPGECVVGAGTSPFKILRMIRILRLFKIVRLLKASRVLARMERRNSLPYAYISFFSVLIQVCARSVPIACVQATATPSSRAHVSNSSSPLRRSF